MSSSARGQGTIWAIRFYFSREKDLKFIRGLFDFKVWRHSLRFECQIVQFDDLKVKFFNTWQIARFSLAHIINNFPVCTFSSLNVKKNNKKYQDSQRWSSENIYITRHNLIKIAKRQEALRTRLSDYLLIQREIPINVFFYHGLDNWLHRIKHTKKLLWTSTIFAQFWRFLVIFHLSPNLLHKF